MRRARRTWCVRRSGARARQRRRWACFSSLPLFAIPRMAGRRTQWEEMLLDPEQKIAPPRQFFLGAARREYVPLERRK